MNTLKTIFIAFACIYIFHSLPSAKDFILDFFSGMEEKLLPSDMRTDVLNTLIDTVEPTPEPVPNE